MTKRERLVLGAILAVALALRVGWCVYAARPPSGSLHDPNFYYLYGHQLANGNGYRLLKPAVAGCVGPHCLGEPTAYYPPGYPFALAPFMWLGDHTPLNHFRNVDVGIVASLNILWQLLTIAMAFLIARRVTGRALAGHVAAAVLALWPNLIFHTAVALTESLFMFLLLTAVLLAVSAPWDRMRWEPLRLVSLGLVLGAATLVRPVTIPVLPALFVVLVVARVGWRRAAIQTAVVTAVAVAVIMPWMIRNAVVMHSFTLSTNTGDNLCMSRRVGGTGGFEFPNDRCLRGPFETLGRPQFETARDAHGRKLAIEFVRQHPAEELRLVFRRIGATFDDDADGLAAVESYGGDPFLSKRTREDLRVLATTYGALAALAGAAGLALLVRKRTPSGLFVVLSGVGMLVPPLVFFGDARFHVPAVPLAAVGAGALVSGLAYREVTSARS
ncbi:MAG: hypothetical protein QOI47_818 [Actinomycetota bacterium]|nr:hypothetical protein [Actinomycetota bacterium]